jgi:hypothetical protein
MLLERLNYLFMLQLHAVSLRADHGERQIFSKRGVGLTAFYF